MLDMNIKPFLNANFSDSPRLRKELGAKIKFRLKSRDFVQIS